MRFSMRLCLMLTAFALILLLAASTTVAQPGGKGKGKTETVDEFVDKVMAFNKAKDGKLTKTELTDPRLHALFDRADTNKDGVVTRAELEALFAREKLEGGGFGGPDGDKKGKGGPDGEKKGKGPKGGGPPRPGQVLPPFIQDALDLTDSQKTQIADLQKEVDAKLEKILTAEQRQKMSEMRGKGKGPKGPPPDNN
jgi:hypothetical protein